MLTLRFACELALIAALVWWGWPWRGIVGGAAAIAIWGGLVAPKARRRLPDPARLAVEVILFSAATVGFLEVGETIGAIVFAVAAAATALAVRIWPETA